MPNHPKPGWSAALTVACAAALGLARPAAAQLPVTGVPVPQLSTFDDAMQQYMARRAIGAGVLAVMRDGIVIYQRGFGHDLANNPLPENAPMRIASVEKPITAAVVRTLASAGYFSLNDHVFNVGQPGGGALNIAPWGGLGDTRIADITIQNILDHRAGWDRDAFLDPQFRARLIAQEMGVPSPPGRTNTVRWMLSQQLQYAPGTPSCDQDGQPPGCYPGDMYSNFGYMVLGLIVEQEYGQTLQIALRQLVLTTDLWVPGTELFFGRTFRPDQSPREPFYWTADMVESVFDPGGLVPKTYGGWEHEVLAGHGNLVASAAPLLRFADKYTCRSGVDSGLPLNGSRVAGGHLGFFSGTSTAMIQRADGINIVVLFNRKHENGEEHYAGELADSIATLIDAGSLTWPTFDVEGFWVDFNLPLQAAVGSFDDPFRSMSNAIIGTFAGTKLRIKPGVSQWTGTIGQKMRLDAPFGAAVIGAQ